MSVEHPGLTTASPPSNHKNAYFHTHSNHIRPHTHTHTHTYRFQRAYRERNKRGVAPKPLEERVTRLAGGGEPIGQVVHGEWAHGTAGSAWGVGAWGQVVHGRRCMGTGSAWEEVHGDR